MIWWVKTTHSCKIFLLSNCHKQLQYKPKNAKCYFQTFISLKQYTMLHDNPIEATPEESQLNTNHGLFCLPVTKDLGPLFQHWLSVYSALQVYMDTIINKTFTFHQYCQYNYDKASVPTYICHQRGTAITTVTLIVLTFSTISLNDMFQVLTPLSAIS